MHSTLLRIRIRLFKTMWIYADPGTATLGLTAALYSFENMISESFYSEMPAVPAFPTYTRSGEVLVTITMVQRGLTLSSVQLKQGKLTPPPPPHTSFLIILAKQGHVVSVYFL
jgi:hypothetical protein